MRGDDAGGTIALVVVALTVLVYCAVGSKGKDKLVLATGVVVAVMLCALARRSAPIDPEPIEAMPAAMPVAAVGAVTAPAGRVKRAVQRADDAVALAAGAAAAAEALEELAEAVGAAAPVDEAAAERTEEHFTNQAALEFVEDSSQPIDAPMPPQTQISGQVPDLPPVPDVVSPVGEIRDAIDVTLRRGACPQFIRGPDAPQEVYDALIHSSTQANLNQALVDIVSTREPDPTLLYYRRERLETALAQDLISYQRNEGRTVQDRHLQEVSADVAAISIAEARQAADEARAVQRRGLHIGTV